MSQGTVFLLIVAAMFPTLIIVAVAVKLWEVRKAARWPETRGKVIASGVKSHKKTPGEPGYNFGDTEVTNEPRVEYQYKVDGKTYRCSRITIGERTTNEELEEILERYPVGKEVTVYYDPSNPNKALLERELPAGVMFAGVGCLLLFFVGGPLIGLLAYRGSVDWLKHHLASPGRAPFVAAAGGFGLVAAWFAAAFTKMVRQATSWPITYGRVVASGVEAFQDYDPDTHRRRRLYKPTVQYSYEVNGRPYLGDRVTMGVVVSGTLPGMAKRQAAKYPVGTEVEVYYNPEAPGESVLHPHSMAYLFLWLIAAGMFTLAWVVATGKLG